MTNFLTNDEKGLIMQIASKLGAGKMERLIADLADANVKYREEDNSRIEFDIPGYVRPPYRGQHSYGVEGRMTDADGSELSVVLYADENGRLLELEFIRWDGSKLIRPNWSSLTL